MITAQEYWREGMSLVLHGLESFFVAARLRHRKHTEVAKSLNIVPVNNSNNKVALGPTLVVFIE